MKQSDNALASLFSALLFAAEKHSQQHRKDSDATPYINHPIAVAELLIRVGQVVDYSILEAAILHDTLEDTQTTTQEIQDRFGAQVCAIVQELTDDKHLPKQERKKKQVEHAPHLSAPAKLIKIADKISNINEITCSEPAEWPVQRKRDYLDWAEQVVAGCRGCNRQLEERFDVMLKEKRRLLEACAGLKR